MAEKFKLEIISPDQSLLNTEVKQVIIPAYEGYMTILKDHISLITFLRPGFIETDIENKTERFYVEEGTVEFFNNKLLILTTFSINLEKLKKENIINMIAESKVFLQNTEIKDKEKYIVNHKIDTLQQIS
jgi:F-type H+-transporting ATPase subunit epsilon